MSSEETAHPGADAAGGRRPPGYRQITDPRAMRALAHPVRIALLEALAHAGTLTATQAGELLGESPANCAFHLRTLARYGYVEEAGGGRGRERPWRRVHQGLDVPADQPDPAAAVAAAELSKFWLDWLWERARVTLDQQHAWPQPWRRARLGASQHVMYLTPTEAERLMEEAHALFLRYFDRVDHPDRRPEGSMPVEALLFAYPLLHLAGVGAAGADSPEPES